MWLPLGLTPLATAGDDDSRAGNRLSTFGNFLVHQVGNQAGARGLPDLVAQVLGPAGGLGSLGGGLVRSAMLGGQLAQGELAKDGERILYATELKAGALGRCGEPLARRRG